MASISSNIISFLEYREWSLLKLVHFHLYNCVSGYWNVKVMFVIYKTIISILVTVLTIFIYTSAIKPIDFSLVLLGRLSLGTKWLLTSSLRAKKKRTHQERGLIAGSIHRKFYIRSYERAAALLVNFNCGHQTILLNFCIFE